MLQRDGEPDGADLLTTALPVDQYGIDSAVLVPPNIQGLLSLYNPDVFAAEGTRLTSADVSMSVGDTVQILGGRGITRTGMGAKVEGFKNYVKYAAAEPPAARARGGRRGGWVRCTADAAQPRLRAGGHSALLCTAFCTSY